MNECKNNIILNFYKIIIKLIEGSFGDWGLGIWGLGVGGGGGTRTPPTHTPTHHHPKKKKN